MKDDNYCPECQSEMVIFDEEQIRCKKCGLVRYLPDFDFKKLILSLSSVMIYDIICVTGIILQELFFWNNVLMVGFLIISGVCLFGYLFILNKKGVYFFPDFEKSQEYKSKLPQGNDVNVKREVKSEDE